jgi:hypothetical protein
MSDLQQPRHISTLPIVSCCFCQLSKHSGRAVTRRRGHQCVFRGFWKNASRFAESASPFYGDADPQNRSAAFLGAPGEVEKEQKLTHFLTHTQAAVQICELFQFVTTDNA